MPTQQNGTDPALRSLAGLKRWIDRYFGETYGVVPFHRISGSISSQQIGGEPSDGDVPTRDSTDSRGVKWTAPADTEFATDADLAAHEADTTDVHGITDTALLATDAEVASAVATHDADTTNVHGITDTANLARKDTKADLPASVAYEDEANVFDQQQEISTLDSSGVGFRVKHPSSSTSDDSRLDRGELVIQKTVAGGTVLTSARAGDAANRLQLWDNGLTEAGDGTVAPATAGLRSINSIAGTPDANTFTKKQIIAPDSDTQALDLRVGTGSTGPFRIRNNADSADLVTVSNTGKLVTAGAAFGNARVEAVGDATASGDAVSRSFGDTRYVLASSLPASGSAGTAWPLVPATLGTPAASVAFGTANLLFIVPIRIAVACTVTGLRYRVGATSSNAVKVSLFSSTGSTKVAEKNSNTTQGTANTIQDVSFTSTAALSAGLYWAAIMANNIASTFTGWASTDYGAPAKTELQGSFTNPSSITPPAATSLPSAAVPWVTVF